MHAHDTSPDDPTVSSETTGELGGQQPIRAVWALGPYRITVRLDAEGRLVAIEAVEVAADFVDARRKTLPPTFHDVRDLYQDE